MKKQRLLRELSNIDEKYVEEAADNAKRVRSLRVKRAWGAVAACFCCAVLAASLWLFLPLKAEERDLSQYADSEYYGIIVKLNEVLYKPGPYKNNFEKHFRGIFKGAMAEDDRDLVYSETADGNGSATGTVSSSYEEVTDNQVDGVIEGDLIKRSNTHIYYLNNDNLEVYTINKEASRLVGAHGIRSHIDNSNRYFSAREMYLSGDCKTVTVISQAHNGERIYTAAMYRSRASSLSRVNTFPREYQTVRCSYSRAFQWADLTFPTRRPLSRK